VGGSEGCGGVARPPPPPPPHTHTHTLGHTSQTYPHPKHTSIFMLSCRYEGDLMAAANVSFTVGREANTTYNESEAGRRNPSSSNENNFRTVVDPFWPNGTVLPGLLSPAEAARIAGRPGEADDKIMSYNFRLCTTKKESRIPFPKPEVCVKACASQITAQLTQSPPLQAPLTIPGRITPPPPPHRSQPCMLCLVIDALAHSLPALAVSLQSHSPVEVVQ
jgi:hypothetical protein